MKSNIVLCVFLSVTFTCSFSTISFSTNNNTVQVLELPPVNTYRKTANYFEMFVISK